MKTKNACLNWLIREKSQCSESLLNFTNAAQKCIFFSAKCNSGRIAIQWFHIKHLCKNPNVYLPGAVDSTCIDVTLIIANKYVREIIGYCIRIHQHISLVLSYKYSAKAILACWVMKFTLP